MLFIFPFHTFNMKILISNMEIFTMETLKNEAMNAIAKLPDSATIDEIMYRLYVIEKVRKGVEAIERGESISLEDLKREMKSW